MVLIEVLNTAVPVPVPVLPRAKRLRWHELSRIGGVTGSFEKEAFFKVVKENNLWVNFPCAFTEPKSHYSSANAPVPVLSSQYASKVTLSDASNRQTPSATAAHFPPAPSYKEPT